MAGFSGSPPGYLASGGRRMATPSHLSVTI